MSTNLKVMHRLSLVKVSSQDSEPVTSMCFRAKTRCGPCSTSGFSFNFNDRLCDDPAGDDDDDDEEDDDDDDDNWYHHDSWWLKINHIFSYSPAFYHQAGPDQPCGEEDSGNLGAKQGSVQWLQLSRGLQTGFVRPIIYIYMHLENHSLNPFSTKSWRQKIVHSCSGSAFAPFRPVLESIHRGSAQMPSKVLVWIQNDEFGEVSGWHFF